VSRVCVETHALVWYLSKPKRLGRAARRLLQAADAGRLEVFIPAITPVELSLLRDAGRDTVGVPQLEALLTAQPAFKLLALDLPQAVEFSRLQSIKDPFDRLVIAAARVAHTPLITADAGIHDSALVEAIWD
jgi:PIN domain nuclease of toxin-antitoxin system